MSQDFDQSEDFRERVKRLQDRGFTPGIFATTRFNNKAVAVAVIGQVADWAAYWGPNLMDVNEIARTGDKLTEAAARKLFPQLDALAYRA